MPSGGHAGWHHVEGGGAVLWDSPLRFSEKCRPAGFRDHSSTGHRMISKGSQRYSRPDDQQKVLAIVLDGGFFPDARCPADTDASARHQPALCATGAPPSAKSCADAQLLRPSLESRPLVENSSEIFHMMSDCRMHQQHTQTHHAIACRLSEFTMLLSLPLVDQVKG
jgi:hypothetical protein